MGASQNEQEYLLDGEILIYIRDGAKKRTWQSRFRNPLADSPRYIRISTKTESKALAIERAITHYREYQSRKFLGLTHGHTTIKQLLDSFKTELDDVGQKMAYTAYDIYWSKYMKDDDISKWTSDDWRDYFLWRIQEQIKRPEGRYFKPSDKSVSANTLKLERIILKRLTLFGYKHNLIARQPIFPERFERLEGVHKLPSNRRRGRFHHEKHYQTILMPEFKRIAVGLKKRKNRPAPVNPRKEWNPKTNPYISRAKSMVGVDVKKRMDDEDYKFTCVRPRYNLAQFWFMSLLIANTGIRPAEIVKLRHRDISVREDPEDGRFYTIIQITPETSKIGKYREAFARDFHMTWDRYEVFRQETEHYFNRKIQPDDWMFPRSWKDGKLRYDLRVDRLNNIFRPHLQRLGLHKTTVEGHEGVEVYFSAYSFRSYYITQRLKEGLNIYTLSKNAGVSIQTIMSTYDYSENWAYRKEMTKHFKEQKGQIPTSAHSDRLRMSAKRLTYNVENKDEQ
jgi:integrase